MVIATLSFLIALSLMLFVGAASYFSRGALRRGGAIMCMALGLAAATLFQIYPALRLTDGGSDDAFRVAEFDKLKAVHLFNNFHEVSKTREFLASV